MNPIVTARITEIADSLATGSLTLERLTWALDQVAQTAYAEGRADALLSLRTADDAAAAWNVSSARARAHIANLHRRYAVGMRIGGPRRGAWLITQQEIDSHPPDATRRRK